MMTSAQIRQSYLDFFRARQHTIVPSSSLMPDSPNLLFTNAGMNQFVPIFLGKIPCPYQPGRAADTQKCIRAGGKHNDLEDVGLDTYHHTFFEMLGNWSFGDYFKAEAIAWAWELLTQVWKFPPARLFATVYKPDPSKGDPADFDQEAYDHWARIFTAAGLDPAVHIVYGNKKDNFWMMGDTGPCGPCSEIHVDLTPGGDTRGSLVNKGSAECIEIWNLVFIQFNANADGSFVPLPARHVDTGMGFERVSGIVQCTKGFSDFSRPVSNYESDVFRPIFDELQRMSGKRYASTLPAPGTAGASEQEKIDVAFRVIADHIRTLSFAIADGIQPGNTDRHYVLRRILRRAVRYGRSLGFREPFFYKLVQVLTDHMGDVFPEIRARKSAVEETLRIEEEAFNRTLDRGIELFRDEVARIRGAHAPSRAADRAPAVSPGARYSRRNLPHFERPWAKYAISFSTRERRTMSPTERDLVMNSIRYAQEHGWIELYAACVMPDHVHLLLEPQIKEQDSSGQPEFWPISDILQGIKSSSAHAINKNSGESGPVWEKESFDRLLRSEADLVEKFEYICRNPWENKVVGVEEDYSWLWTAERSVGEGADACTRGRVRSPEQQAPAVIDGAFAFKLYDTYGFPLDLTELMAREQGLTVDNAGFEANMEQQRARARAAQKKEVIEVSQISADVATSFIGYDVMETPARVVEVISVKGRTAVLLDRSPCYAEMGGQVGDTGLLRMGGTLWRVVDTQKAGHAWLHFVEGEDAPEKGAEVVLSVDLPRRNAIQRHHTVTHLFHWALHEVANREASQKGSFVGPDKLTFDFNSGALTAGQLHDIEKLVNERIVENAPVSWTEAPHASVKSRKDVMQFFGDKYGETVRVVQVGGAAGALDGYSMELCGGTHTRATGEIGLFRIVSEGAIAAGVRRVEAVAGLAAWQRNADDLRVLKSVAATLNSAPADLEKRVEAVQAHQKELEKQLKALKLGQAGDQARALESSGTVVNGIPLIVANLGDADGDTVAAVAEALKARVKGVVVLGSAAGGSVVLLAQVSPEFTAKVQAGKIIQAIAPVVGGKGGGKPDFARGGGKDASKLEEALAKAPTLLV
jgi:alanyl-tRNA synthetase/REP element-mobilizing transposase RayT